LNNALKGSPKEKGNVKKRYTCRLIPRRSKIPEALRNKGRILSRGNGPPSPTGTMRKKKKQGEEGGLGKKRRGRVVSQRKLGVTAETLRDSCKEKERWYHEMRKEEGGTRDTIRRNHPLSAVTRQWRKGKTEGDTSKKGRLPEDDDALLKI